MNYIHIKNQAFLSTFSMLSLVTNFEQNQFMSERGKRLKIKVYIVFFKGLTKRLQLADIRLK